MVMITELKTAYYFNRCHCHGRFCCKILQIEKIVFGFWIRFDKTNDKRTGYLEFLQIISFSVLHWVIIIKSYASSSWRWMDRAIG